MSARLALLAVLPLLALAGCGGAAADAPRDDPGPVHVHGLGVNPADGALYVATHTGLWRVAGEGAAPERVGAARHDLMGFTIADADRFLASGHPDLRSDLPPLLGLVESTDGGESWTPVSLLGEADFHALRAASHSLLYGYDASGGRLLVTDDGGSRWTERAVPEPLVDLVVDPRDPHRLLAAGERRLHHSPDGGSTWQEVARGAGLLAWPAPRSLYLVAGDGAVWASADGGRDWRRSGSIGGAPAAFLATSERELYAALHDGSIMRSRDGGASWSPYSGGSGPETDG